MIYVSSSSNFFFSYDLICPIFNRQASIISIDRCDFHLLCTTITSDILQAENLLVINTPQSSGAQIQCNPNAATIVSITGHILPSAMSDTRARAQRLISVVAATMIALACGTNVGQIYSSAPFPLGECFLSHR